MTSELNVIQITDLPNGWGFNEGSVTDGYFAYWKDISEVNVTIKFVLGLRKLAVEYRGEYDDNPKEIFVTDDAVKANEKALEVMRKY